MKIITTFYGIIFRLRNTKLGFDHRTFKIPRDLKNRVASHQTIFNWKHGQILFETNCASQTTGCFFSIKCRRDSTPSPLHLTTDNSPPPLRFRVWVSFLTAHYHSNPTSITSPTLHTSILKTSTDSLTYTLQLYAVLHFYCLLILSTVALLIE